MFFRRRITCESTQSDTNKPSPAEEAALMSKIWQEHVKKQVKDQKSKKSDVRLRLSRGSKYQSTFVDLPASEMASLVSEIWRKENATNMTNSRPKKVKSKMEMLNIIAIDGSTKQVPLYKRKMKVLYNNSINVDDWTPNTVEAYIIDIHYNRTAMGGEPIYTVLLADGRETETDCSRIKLPW